MGYVHDPEGVAEDRMNLQTILPVAVGRTHGEMQLPNPLGDDEAKVPAE